MDSNALSSGMIRVDVSDHVMRITIDRADKRNALTREMYQDMDAAIQHAGKTDDVHVVRIDGEGDMFCAGNDIADFAKADTDTQSEGAAGPALTLIKTLIACDKPVVVAVQGQATGIGTTLLLHVDFVIAAESARFFTAFIDLALVPEAASSLILPRLIGRQNAARLLMAGDTFDAAEAERMGLIAYRVADAELADKTTALCAKLAKKSQASLKYTKQLMRDAVGADELHAQIDREAKLFGERLVSDEVRQIMNQFMNRKR